MLSVHRPVLLQEVIEGLALHEGAIVLDGTINGGGHSEAITKVIGTEGVLIGMDLDEEALKRAEERLRDTGTTVHLINRNFKEMDEAAAAFGIREVDAILLDLGFSSDQLERGERGISFKADEPLLMTLASNWKRAPFTARDIVNDWAEADIANVLYGYGEERYARRIAKQIVETRKKHPLETTDDLVRVIEASVPHAYRKGKIHPATKTFQALRIVVNDELESLKIALQKSFELLKPKGRLAVISFHSIEDRIVKRMFTEAKKRGVGTPTVKKPISATREEIRENPRARSAKLRIFEKS